MKKALSILAAIIALHSASAVAQEFSGGVRLANKYLNSRGFLASSEPSAQAFADLSFDLAGGKFTLGGWTDFDLDGTNVENDWLFTFARQIAKTPVGNLEGAIQHANYQLPGVGTAREWNVTLSLDNKWNPKLFFAHDYSELGAGEYTEISVSPTVNIKDQPVNLSLAVNHNNHHWTTDTGLAGVMFKASTEVRPNLSVGASYFVATRSDFDDQWDLGMTYTF